MFTVAIDYDGVITANFEHYRQLASDFLRSGCNVYVLTAARYERQQDIGLDLVNKFPFTSIIFRPKDFISTTKNIGEWKKEKLLLYKIDLWFENDIKFYEQAGVVFPDIPIIRI